MVFARDKAQSRSLKHTAHTSFKHTVYIALHKQHTLAYDTLDATFNTQNTHGTQHLIRNTNDTRHTALVRGAARSRFVQYKHIKRHRTAAQKTQFTATHTAEIV
jgi:hypothetical protein